MQQIKNLSNITNDGKKAITGLGTIVEAADNTITVTNETDNVTGQKNLQNQSQYSTT